METRSKVVEPNNIGLIQLQVPGYSRMGSNTAPVQDVYPEWLLDYAGTRTTWRRRPSRHNHHLKEQRGSQTLGAIGTNIAGQIGWICGKTPGENPTRQGISAHQLA